MSLKLTEVPFQPISLSKTPSQSMESEMLPSQLSDVLSPDVEKTEAVYQEVSDRKRKLSNCANTTQKIEFAMPASLTDRAVVSVVPTKDDLILKEAVQEAGKKYHQGDFKGALETIKTIFSKIDILILRNQILSKTPIQEEHLQLLKIKGLCLVEAVKEHISLESSVKIHAALSILIPLQGYKAEDYEIQKALAFCYCSLALCPSQKNLKAAHQLKADEAFKKAHDLRPTDISIIPDWSDLKLQRGKYTEALQIIIPVRSSLEECQDKSMLIAFLTREILCNIFLATDNTDNIRDYYREQAQKSFNQLKSIVGPKDNRIRQFRTSYPDIFRIDHRRS